MTVATAQDMRGAVLNIAALERAQVLGPEPEQEREPGPLPLTPEVTRVRGRLIAEPAELPPLLLAYGRMLAPQGIPMMLSGASGLGKTYALIHIAVAVARGGAWGPIQAAEPGPVLYLGAEDPPQELDRRIWRVSGGDPPENLHAASLLGQVKPLLFLDSGGNAKLAEGFFWLRQTIQAHRGTRLFILDPLSRFYGAAENSNENATAFVAALEALCREFSIGILVVHHVSKARAGEQTQFAPRGASGFVDGVRFTASMVPMEEKDATRWGVDCPRDYVLLDVVNSNYAAKLPGPIPFRRNEDGTLEYADLLSERRQFFADALHTELSRAEGKFTRRELVQEKAGKSVADAVKARQNGFVRSRDMGLAIEQLLKAGMMKEIQAGTTRNPRLELCPA